MSTWQDLLRFTREHADQLILTAYVSAAPADPSDRETWMLRLRDGLRHIEIEHADASTAEKRLFAASVERLWKAAPAQGTMPRDHSWACYVAANGDTLTLQIPPGAETQVFWEIGPRLVPYLRVAELSEALVVQVDRQAARLSVYYDGAITTSVQFDATPIDEIAPAMNARPSSRFHHGTHGHTGADEAQRRRRESTVRLHQTAIRRASSMAMPGVPIILGGSPESAQWLLEDLPPALAARTLIAADLRMDPPEQSLDAVRNALHAWREQRQRERLTAWRDEARPGGHAAVGYESAARAAAAHAIAELIFTDSAWRAHPQKVEALVQDALTHGAIVEWAEPRTLAVIGPEADGIVAGLRFPV